MKTGYSSLDHLQLCSMSCSCCIQWCSVWTHLGDRLTNPPCASWCWCGLCSIRASFSCPAHTNKIFVGLTLIIEILTICERPEVGGRGSIYTWIGLYVSCCPSVLIVVWGHPSATTCHWSSATIISSAAGSRRSVQFLRDPECSGDRWHWYVHFSINYEGFIFWIFIAPPVLQ